MKKTRYFFLFALFIISGIYIQGITAQSEDSLFVDFEPFGKILEDNQIRGSILVWDSESKTYYSNDFDWAHIGRLPASTYKIPHSIIALETGVVKDSLSLFPWDGKDRFLDIWEQDLNFKQALQYSCVPCYQEIAKKIGVERMNAQLAKLQYGDMDVRDDNLTVFWLEGDSRISQFEQIDFLKRLYYGQLPITKHSRSTIRNMMILEKGKQGILSGKTGWAIRKGHNNGWFVGYFEAKDRVLIFATNVDPQKAFNMEFFPVIRKKVTITALKSLIDKY